jgi:hypothetical protein
MTYSWFGFPFPWYLLAAMPADPTQPMSREDIIRRRLEAERMYWDGLIHAPVRVTVTGDELRRIADARAELAATIFAHREGRVHINSPTVLP